MSADYDMDVSASRKLTDEEASELREIILKDLKFSSEDKEDVEDLLDYTFAMVSNSKAVGYVVEELVSMDMDVCKQDTAHGIGRQIAKFIVEHINPVQTESQGQEGGPPPRKVASTKKSTAGANALTMSGALGAARKGEKKPDQGPKKADEGHRSGNQRGGDGRGRNQSDRRGGGGRSIASRAFDRLSGRNDSARGGRDDGRRRGPSAGREGERARRGRGEGARGGGGRGGRGDMGRGGRGDAGPGRGSPSQRGGGGGGRGPALSGTRRSRDEMRAEEDFIPAGGRGGRADGRFGGRDGGRGRVGDAGRGRGGRGPDFQNGRGGDGSGRGRGGRGREFQDGRGGDGRGKGGRGADFSEANKRQRIDDSERGNETYSDNYYDESWEGYGARDEGYYDSSWRGGYGGRVGRGHVRGGRGGRSGRGHDIEQGEAGASAAGEGEAAGESWDGYSGYDEGYYASTWYGGYRGGRGARGRGRGGRGRGVFEEGEPGAPPFGETTKEAAEGHPSPLVHATFGGDYGGLGFRGRGRDRGRGRGFYRAQIATMIASKSWVRPKPSDSEGGGREGGGGGEAAGGE